MKLSYAIPVCNEIKEIKRLLEFLIKTKRVQDEIVILIDEQNGTEEVKDYVEDFAHQYLNFDFVNVYYHPLNGDFATHKNFLNSCCKGDYIFQIDADEIPNEYLIEALPYILEINQDVDMFRVPRVNTVEGLTEEHIKKWGWRVNEKGWVNWADWQMRIYRKHPDIKWVNKVHEVIEGYKIHGMLPAEKEYALYHPKDIERQEKQNKYYETL